MADGIPLCDNDSYLSDIGPPFFLESKIATSQNGLISKQWDILILNLLNVSQEILSLGLINQKLWQLAMNDVDKVSLNFETVDQVKKKIEQSKEKELLEEIEN